MDVAKTRPTDHQLPLWDWVGDRPLHTMAQSRTFCGDFFEEATAVLTTASRLKTVNDHVCPDLRLSRSVYFEVKSVGRSNDGIVYQHRLVKERTMIEKEAADIHYVFWRHKASVKEHDSLHKLRAALVEHLIEVIMIDHTTLHAMLVNRPTKMMNYSNRTAKGDLLGYGINGYGIGWSIRMNELRALADVCTITRPLVVYGIQIPGVIVWCTQPEHLGFVRSDYE